MSCATKLHFAHSNTRDSDTRDSDTHDSDIEPDPVNPNAEECMFK